MRQATLDWSRIDPLIEKALEEDLGDGDIAGTALFSPQEQSTAYMLAKAQGVIAGLPVAGRVFQQLDRDLIWEAKISDGETVKTGDLLVEFYGNRRALLGGERLALNILQRLSGIASLTARYVAKVEGLPVKILDTRKTTPGLRLLEKYAVTVGGGQNHRFGLFDGIMIKDNHIKLAGGIISAVQKMRRHNPRRLPIEVETTTAEEVQEALAAGADIIMLDNMTPEQMREAVRLITRRAKVEASGGITLETVRAIAKTGVDFISVGALTHSAPALDIGMYFME